jgi:hypothetical protein
MKNLSYLIITLSIVSCSPKYTASFQDYNVYSGNTILPNPPNEVTSTNTISDLPTTELMASSENTPTEFKTETRMPSKKSNELSKSELKSLKKQTKSIVNPSIKKMIQGDPAKVGNPRKNWAAVLGIICSILGIVVPIIVIPGIIFSAIGLKSEKRKLAMAGLIIGIIVFIVQLILFAIAYAEAAAYGTFF